MRIYLILAITFLLVLSGCVKYTTTTSETEISEVEKVSISEPIEQEADTDDSASKEITDEDLLPDVELDEIKVPKNLEFDVDNNKILIQGSECLKIKPQTTGSLEQQKLMIDTCIEYCEKADFTKFTMNKYCDTSKNLVCYCE